MTDSSEYSSKSVLVVDRGQFADFARALTASFGKVQLYVPWESEFPRARTLWVGRGLHGVEKVDELWPAAKTADLVIFPGLLFGDLQAELRARGRRVWGAGKAEELELFRDFAKKAFKKAGIEIGPYVVVRGITALIDHLKDRTTPCYVKVSRTRGDTETFKCTSLRKMQPKIDTLAHDLGPVKESIDFIVEDLIEDAVEIGYDGPCIDGQYPEHASCGIEVKDKGYVAHYHAIADMPEQVRDLNERLGKMLKRSKYRQFLSYEARVTKDGTAYLIDPCLRFGSPPSQLYTYAWTNLADILWHGADGEVVDPVSRGEWGAELMLQSAGWAAHEEWQPVDFPKGIADQVRIANPVGIDGRMYCAPQGYALDVVGAASATGDTMQEAIEACKAVAEQVEGCFLDVPMSSFDDAEQEIATLKDYGITL